MTTEEYAMDNLVWKINLPGFLNEINENSKCTPYKVTFTILARILGILAQRAIELNDPILNIIMLNCSLYDVEHKKIDEYIQRERERIIKQVKEEEK